MRRYNAAMPLRLGERGGAKRSTQNSTGGRFTSRRPASHVGRRGRRLWRAAQNLASDAVTAEPWGASPYDQRALVELVRGDSAAARADALHAVRHERLNYRRWLMVALAEKQRGNDRAARRAYRTARPLAPAASSFEAGLENALRVGIRGLAP